MYVFVYHIKMLSLLAFPFFSKVNSHSRQLLSHAFRFQASSPWRLRAFGFTPDVVCCTSSVTSCLTHWLLMFLTSNAYPNDCYVN